MDKMKPLNIDSLRQRLKTARISMVKELVRLGLDDIIMGYVVL